MIGERGDDPGAGETTPQTNEIVAPGAVAPAVAPETVPPETVPPETVPPETVPPETVPPENGPPDSVMAVRAADVAGVPDIALRDAMEFAVGIAAAGQKLRPPLPFPAGLKTFLRFQRLDKTSLPLVRRTVAADDEFRDRLGLVATEELLDEISVVWLKRPDGWQERVVQLHAAARAEAQAEAGDVALRKAERRRDAAEQVAARALAERLAQRDEISREQARREKAEAKASAAVAESETVRRELQQVQRELEKLRSRVIAETERADRGAAEALVAAAQVQSLEQMRDDMLAYRATALLPSSAAEPVAPDNAPAAQALRQAAAATRDLAEALASAAGALASGDTATAHRPTLEDTPMASARGSASSGSRPRPQRRRHIPIPGGVYGDSTAAAEHLLRSPQVVVIVDGYNVAKLGWPQLGLAQQRECCISLLEDLARRFGTDIRVVFDGADVVGASSPRRLIRVQFSPSGVTADDVIRVDVAALPATTPVVVVTNDQAIVADVHAAGANVLSSDVLLRAGGRSAQR
ncbi:MAG: hypothetical protein F2789_11185 [Actinobacteria bacterium]|nr:hypothetical protein [Actinomycetota bacterium]